MVLVLPESRGGWRRAAAAGVSLTLHLSALATLGLLSAGAAISAGAAAQEPLVEYVTALPAAPPQATDRLLTEAHDATPAAAAEQLTVSGVALDIAKVRARQHDLFPFLTLDLQFLAQVPANAATPRRLLDPLSAAARTRLPPLAMTGAALQQVLDRAWSRRQRWHAFGGIAALLAAHDADDGRLPDVLRGYLDQNILQPFCDSDTRDPRFWAMLDNAADHADFIDLVRSYARRHPSSRTTTELLFLLDELAQASQDVLLMLVETRPARDLGRTAATDREAYRLATEIRDRYGRWLLAHGLGSAADIKARYADLRLRLLTTIIETTPQGYREADARFLAGEIAFAGGRTGEAAGLWNGIRPRAGDAYFRAHSDVLEQLRTGSAAGIRDALQREYARWRLTAIDRLHQFGSSCDSF